MNRLPPELGAHIASALERSELATPEQEQATANHLAAQCESIIRLSGEAKDSRAYSNLQVSNTPIELNHNGQTLYGRVYSTGKGAQKTYGMFLNEQQGGSTYLGEAPFFRLESPQKGNFDLIIGGYGTEPDINNPQAVAFLLEPLSALRGQLESQEEMSLAVKAMLKERQYNVRKRRAKKAAAIVAPVVGVALAITARQTTEGLPDTQLNDELPVLTTGETGNPTFVNHWTEQPGEAKFTRITFESIFGGNFSETHCQKITLAPDVVAPEVTAVTDYHDNDYFTRDSPSNDQFDVAVTDGVVEVCWYQPSVSLSGYNTEHPVVGVKID
jgi:hypothetical protein